MFTAIDINTGKHVSVKPVAIYKCLCTRDELLIADSNTGNGLWFDPLDREWHIDLEDGSLTQDSEKIEVIFGEEERKAAANAKLAAYGLKLGAFVKKDGDRYALVEA